MPPRKANSFQTVNEARESFGFEQLGRPVPPVPPTRPAPSPLRIVPPKPPPPRNIEVPPATGRVGRGSMCARLGMAIGWLCSRFLSRQCLQECDSGWHFDEVSGAVACADCNDDASKPYPPPKAGAKLWR